jgi:hypothetical protein
MGRVGRDPGLTLLLHDAHWRHTGRIDTAVVIRRALILLVCTAFVLPVAALAATKIGEGTLSVDEGRGKVTIEARGGFIGRIDAGTVTIHDLTPDDEHEPFVFGDDRPVRFLGETGIQRGGVGLRFRLAGGRYRLVVQGRGIDLSVVGKGAGTIKSDGEAGPGVYSLDGADCRRLPESCKPLPELTRVFQLGTAEKS